MKIVDNAAPPSLTLASIMPGEVVRLKNNKVYMVGVYNYSGEQGLWRPAVRERVLINLTTGLAHKLGEDSIVTRVDATLNIGG